MKLNLIGAGRGIRLMPFTATEPKSFTTVAERRILDWILEAFLHNGLDDFVFIGGYLIEVVRANYPEFLMVENADWANNNILFSLMHARDYMKDGFYATYTDTLFRPGAVAALEASPHDITLVMDTLWHERYRYRSKHPETDAEKIVARGDRVVRVSRAIDPEEATGEFTGLMRLSAGGATRFLDYYDGLYRRLGPDGILMKSVPFRMAYLIHQLELMIQDGIDVHCVHVPGEYHEIDTMEDYHLASKDWARFAQRTQ